MKLKTFIEALERIAKSVEHPEAVEVEMADRAPVVQSIFKDGTVFITDVEQES
ncbi:MAG TPA: hypothetical protein VNG29_01690 [Candidatus Paceibacterota bacterium]|nr:hypothetical protein [Candidatus Paceibacterota bacterium]